MNRTYTAIGSTRNPVTKRALPYRMTAQDFRVCLVTLESLATLSAAPCTALIQPVESVCPFISRSIWFWNSLYRSSYQSGNFQLMTLLPAAFSIDCAELIDEEVTW